MHRRTRFLLETIGELLDVVSLIQADGIGGERDVNAYHKSRFAEVFHAVDSLHILSEGVSDSLARSDVEDVVDNYCQN